MKIQFVLLFAAACTHAVYVDKAAVLDFPSTMPTLSSTLTIDTSGLGDGVLPGYPVALGIPPECATLGGEYVAWVNATNQVAIRFLNTHTAAIPPNPAIDLPPAIFRVRVFNDDV
jgi:hypothetical protein